MNQEEQAYEKAKADLSPTFGEPDVTGFVKEMRGKYHKRRKPPKDFVSIIDFNKALMLIGVQDMQAEQLQAENKRLREALEEIVKIAGNVNKYDWPAPQQEIQAIASTALKEPEK